MAEPTSWLTGEKPRSRLDNDRLEERILNLLSTHNMGVLATAGESGPIATPVRFFSRDFAVMFTTSPRSPKMRNIAADPRVSFAVHAPLVSLASSRGAQLFGEAEVISSNDDRFDHYWGAFRWESEQIEQGRLPNDDPGTLVVVEAERIVYTEHWLRRDGFAPRQVWTRP